MVQPMTPKIKVIALDMGGVFNGWSFHNLKKILSNHLHVSEELVFESWQGNILPYLRHEIEEHEFWNRFRISAKVSASDEMLRNLTLPINTRRPWMEKLVSHLKKTYIIASVTDHSNWIYDLESRHPFTRLFDHVINSWEEGHLKPDLRLFQKLADLTNSKFSEIIFVDDRSDFGPPLTKEGINFIHYRNKPRFLADLSSFGVNLPNNL